MIITFYDNVNFQIYIKKEGEVHPLFLLNKKPANPNLEATAVETSVAPEETSTENASANGEAWWGGETTSSESAEKATVTE